MCSGQILGRQSGQLLAGPRSEPSQEQNSPWAGWDEVTSNMM